MKHISEVLSRCFVCNKVCLISPHRTYSANLGATMSRVYHWCESPECHLKVSGYLSATIAANTRNRLYMSAKPHSYDR